MNAREKAAECVDECLERMRDTGVDLPEALQLWTRALALLAAYYGLPPSQEAEFIDLVAGWMREMFDHRVQIDIARDWDVARGRREG